MSLSQLYETVRHGRRLSGGSQTFEHARQFEAVVESIGELHEVTRQVFWANRIVDMFARVALRS